MRGNKESVDLVGVCGGAGAQLGHTGLSGGGGGSGVRDPRVVAYNH
jgi:hypothetical protein